MDEILNLLKVYFDLLLNWMGGAIVGIILTAILGQLRILYVRKDYKLPVQVPKGVKRNLILLVGLGGTGKTSLIRSLFRDENINHRKKTEIFSTYCYKHEPGIKQSVSFLRKWHSRHKYHWLYISDYKGQNVAQLLRHFILEQKQPNSPLAFGYINTLVILVDLFPPQEEREMDLRKQQKPNEERINANIEQWNKMTLTMVSGLVTDSLKSVILFINKVDLLSDRSNSTEMQCKELYDDLKQRIEEIFVGVECHVILGSAAKGTNISGVDRNSLMFYLLASSVSS